MPLPPPTHAPTPVAVESVAPGNVPATDAEKDSSTVGCLERLLPSLWPSGSCSQRSPLGIRLVLISDTHGCHRKLTIPDGDVLIHAGDFTRMGLEEDATDFNVWLGELPHPHKLCVNGNHECNAAWKGEAYSMLSNATFLRDESVTIRVAKPDGVTIVPLRVHGTEFCWPMRSRNPAYEAIAVGSSDTPIDVLVAHSPVKGYVDGGKGCAELLRLAERLRPRAVIGGHIHHAHDVQQGQGRLSEITFINAANARSAHTDMGWPPVVLDI